MSKSFEDYVKMVGEKKMTMAAACAEMGISRQTWYNRLKKPPRRFVKKSELAKRVEKLEIENAALIEGMMNRNQTEWMEKLERANDVIVSFLNKTFPNLWCNLKFEHVDTVAYWYTFELVNDDRRQTWCVRHSDLEG